MARKTIWTVRVIVFDTRNGLYLSGPWQEALRYMGHVRVLAHFDNPDRDVLEFGAPKGLDARVWCEQNAARMRSFGIDAAPAPRWADEQHQTGPDGGMEAHNRAAR